MNCRTDMQPSIPSGCMHVDDADPLHSVHSSMNASVLWLTLHIHFMALKAGGGFADTSNVLAAWAVTLQCASHIYGVLDACASSPKHSLECLNIRLLVRWHRWGWRQPLGLLQKGGGSADVGQDWPGIQLCWHEDGRCLDCTDHLPVCRLLRHHGYPLLHVGH